MNDFSKELCWTVKRFFPLGVSLILLGFVVEEFKEIIPPFLESGYVTYVQILFTLGILAFAIWNLFRIRSQIRKGLNKKQVISFGVVIFVTLAGELGANSLAVNIFLLNLFAIAYMPEDPIRNSLLDFSDYVWGLLIVPLVGWYNFRMMRKYLATELELDTCSGIVCWCTRNWIWSSLLILIILNIGLIFY